jgi:hypothetical protein
MFEQRSDSQGPPAAHSCAACSSAASSRLGGAALRAEAGAELRPSSRTGQRFVARLVRPTPRPRARWMTWSTWADLPSGAASRRPSRRRPCSRSRPAARSDRASAGARAARKQALLREWCARYGHRGIVLPRPGRGTGGEATSSRDE